VTPVVLAVLKALEPSPAVIINSRRDLLAYNDVYAQIFPSLAGLRVEERNLLWLIFTSPAWRASMPDWDSAAPRLVAQFRSAMANTSASRPGSHCSNNFWRLRPSSPTCGTA